MAYVYHSTNIGNVINILNDGVLYANKYINEEHRRMSKTEELPYIYTSMYVPELGIENFGVALIFNPTILNQESYIFNYGWNVHPNDKSIYVNSIDNKEMNNNKLNKIIEYVRGSKKITDYEILFIGRIILKDYLIGILCPICDTQIITKIESLLKKKNLNNVKIYMSNEFPQINKI